MDSKDGHQAQSVENPKMCEVCKETCDGKFTFGNIDQQIHTKMQFNNQKHCFILQLCTTKCDFLSSLL
ncbi:hypothetical protein JTE90_012115 [Oedothorax gibbosus]|uniref:Uncharacterized protein n=1 Tax=Oedothorax gibbosus TaxID=931172 RepID=A0AAV6UWT0_9ARAC|nr:hypothetical protein JTE90_012115 [Oedothorax gibbosus]